MLAIHKYDPISFRPIFVNFKTSPLNDVTKDEITRTRKDVKKKIIRVERFV